MKQMLERYELARRWATTFIVLLVVPMVSLQLRNVKLELQQYADKNFIEKVDYKETWQEHDKARTEVVDKLQAQIDATSTEYRSLNQKMDSVGFEIRSLQTQVIELKNKLENIP